MFEVAMNSDFTQEVWEHFFSKKEVLTAKVREAAKKRRGEIQSEKFDLAIQSSALSDNYVATNRYNL